VLDSACLLSVVKACSSLLEFSSFECAMFFSIARDGVAGGVPVGVAGTECAGAASLDNITEGQWAPIKDKGANKKIDRQKWKVKQSLSDGAKAAGFNCDTRSERAPICKASSILQPSHKGCQGLETTFLRKMIRLLQPCSLRQQLQQALQWKRGQARLIAGDVTEEVRLLHSRNRGIRFATRSAGSEPRTVRLPMPAVGYAVRSATVALDSVYVPDAVSRHHGADMHWTPPKAKFKRHSLFVDPMYKYVSELPMC
jgi:hypothetical protein